MHTSVKRKLKKSKPQKRNASPRVKTVKRTKMAVTIEQSISREVVENEDEFQLTPMGVLAPGSAHARHSARPPIDTSGNFSAHMSGGGKLSDSFSDQLSRQIREF